MISLIDFIGALSSFLAALLLLPRLGSQVNREIKWVLFTILLLTALVNSLSVVIWIGIPNGPYLAETWTDYLQILQPALWGILFLTVVQTRQQQEIIQSREKMRALVENMPVILHAYDATGRLLAWNRQAEEITGLESKQVLGREGVIQSLFINPKAQEQLLAECRSRGGDFRHRIRAMQCINGPREIAWYNISKRFPINSWANWCIGLDMTEQLDAQRELEHLATHDELTGLPNRTLLRDRLDRALSDCDRNKNCGALLMFDLDHFKMINDSYGHPVGDQLLREVSARIKQCIKTTDTLSRFSGDEFVILLEDINSAQKAASVANRIINRLCDYPFEIFGQQIRVRCSIGITIFPADDRDIEELMKNMDLALYAAKEQGRNTYHLYSRDMHQKVRRQHILAENLREAIERGDLELYYQPQFNLKTNTLTGVEALLRWPNFENGSVSPAVFVPIAETTGLMPALGQWVVRSAFRQARLWQANNYNFLVAINLSPLQLYQSNLEEFLIIASKDAQIEPSCIELEITESAVMRNLESAIATMQHLKDFGFKISLDDFGTGYSSLSYLKRIPINTLKIDRSFIRDITSSDIDKAIVRSVIQMGHSLKLHIVAEGVETQEQKQFLQEENCDLCQGYLFAKPMPVGDIDAFVEGKNVSMSG